jgi:amino acid transporter
MFERFRSRRDDDDDERARTSRREGEAAGSAAGVREVRARQRDEYGGINWGAAFFGWLVAVGMAAILTGIVSAAGAAIGLTEVSEGEARGSADTISLVGAALLLLLLAIAYYCGGYVSGRMSRFDGGRQGLGVWVIGLLVTILLAVLGAIADSEYNVLAKLELPRIPVDEGSLATGAVITLIAVVVLTILAAMAGGKAGERYHKKVDRVGFAT